MVHKDSELIKKERCKRNGSLPKKEELTAGEQAHFMAEWTIGDNSSVIKEGPFYSHPGSKGAAPLTSREVLQRTHRSMGRSTPLVTGAMARGVGDFSSFIFVK